MKSHCNAQSNWFKLVQHLYAKAWIFTRFSLSSDATHILYMYKCKYANELRGTFANELINISSVYLYTHHTYIKMWKRLLLSGLQLDVLVFIRITERCTGTHSILHRVNNYELIGSSTELTEAFIRTFDLKWLRHSSIYYYKICILYLSHLAQYVEKKEILFKNV